MSNAGAQLKRYRPSEIYRRWQRPDGKSDELFVLNADIEPILRELEWLREQYEAALKVIWCLAHQNGGEVRVSYSTLLEMPQELQIETTRDMSDRSNVYRAIPADSNAGENNG